MKKMEKNIYNYKEYNCNEIRAGYENFYFTLFTSKQITYFNFYFEKNNIRGKSDYFKLTYEDYSSSSHIKIKYCYKLINNKKSENSYLDCRVTLENNLKIKKHRILI